MLAARPRSPLSLPVHDRLVDLHRQALEEAHLRATLQGSATDRLVAHLVQRELLELEELPGSREWLLVSATLGAAARAAVELGEDAEETLSLRGVSRHAVRAWIAAVAGVEVTL